MSFRFPEPRVRVGDGIDSFDGATLSFFEFGTSTPKITFSDSGLTSANTDPVVADGDGLFGDIFTDTKGTVTLKTKQGAVVYGPIDFFGPEDGVLALTASSVAVVDAAGNFTAINVETILAEISDDFLKLARTNTIEAIQTHTAAVQMSDQELRRPLLLDFGIKHNVVSSVSNVTTVDLTTGNRFITTLTENTTLAIINPTASGNEGSFILRVIQDGAGGAFTLTQPGSVIIAAGDTWTVTTSNNARDKGSYSTIDGGTIWELEFLQAYA